MRRFNFESKIRKFNKLVYLTGLGTLSYFTYHSYLNIKPLFFKRQDSLKKLQENYGKGYAVITGPTSGIGLAFANELSRVGFNICLVGRDKERLELVKKSIESKFANNTRIILHDFCNADPVKLIDLKQQLNALGDVSILVNNVGAQYEFTKKFESVEIQNLINYVNVNMLSQLVMYNSLLPKLREQQHKSLIIDVSSIAADNDVMASNIVYSCTKGFNLRFNHLIKFQMQTENLIRNVNVYNIDVAVLKPGRVATNLGFNTNEPGDISPESSVSCCLHDIVNGKFETNGAMRHTFLNFLLKIVPSSLVYKVYSYKRYKQDIIEHDNINLDKQEELK